MSSQPQAQPPSGEKAKRSKFGMVPEELICGRLDPNESTEEHAIACLVYAYLMLRQGVKGRPVQGYRKVAKAIGVQERTVAKAARRLADAGWIELRDGDGRKAQEQAVMNVIHNPAMEGRSNPAARHFPVPDRHGHARREPPVIEPSNPEQEHGLSRVSRTLDPRSPGASRAPSLQRDAHRLQRDAHESDATPVARDAPLSRSSIRSVGVGGREVEAVVCSRCRQPQGACGCPFENEPPLVFEVIEELGAPPPNDGDEPAAYALVEEDEDYWERSFSGDDEAGSA